MTRENLIKTILYLLSEADDKKLNTIYEFLLHYVR